MAECVEERQTQVLSRGWHGECQGTVGDGECFRQQGLTGGVGVHQRVGGWMVSPGCDHPSPPALPLAPGHQHVRTPLGLQGEGWGAPVGWGAPGQMDVPAEQTCGWLSIWE